MMNNLYSAVRHTGICLYQVQERTLLVGRTSNQMSYKMFQISDNYDCDLAGFHTSFWVTSMYVRPVYELKRMHSLASTYSTAVHVA